MQVSVENIDSIARKMTVSVPAEKIKTEIEKQLQKLTRTAKIDGFRPGKVPKEVIQKKLGASVEMDALNKAISESFDEALRQEKLSMAGDPRFNTENAYKPDESFVYTVNFDVFPEIKLKAFSDLMIEKISALVTDDDLAKALEGMQKQHIKFQTVTRPAKQNDKVDIQFVGTVDGVEFEGGKGQMPLVLGSHATIPGFEEGILEAKTGETVTVNVVFPENYGSKDLAGKPAVFTITVNKIEEGILPELNDDFAALFHVSKEQGGFEKLKQETRETLEKQARIHVRQALKTDVMKKLAEAYTDVAVPAAFIKRESYNLLEQMKKQFSQYRGMKLPEFSLEMFAERAKERVLTGLVVNEIIKHEKIMPDDSKVRELIQDIADSYDNPESIVQAYYDNEERLADIKALAIEEQIIDKIMSEATVIEKPVKISDLLGMEKGA